MKRQYIYKNNNTASQKPQKRPKGIGKTRWKQKGYK